MPWIWWRSASSWFASTSTLTSSNSPARASASRSSTGPSMRQGPHQAAQKSTTTGTWCERSSTSRSKLSVVTSIGFVSPSVRQRRAAAGVEVQQLVERAEADRARGEHDRRQREQPDPGDRAGADGEGGDDRRRCGEERAEGAVAVVHVPGHLGLLAVVWTLMLYNSTTNSFIPQGVFEVVLPHHLLDILV